MNDKITPIGNINVFNGNYHGIWIGNQIGLKDYKGNIFYTFDTVESANKIELVSVLIKNQKIVDWDYL